MTEPLFAETAGEHLEHIVEVLATVPPTAEVLLQQHPRTDGEVRS